MSVDVTVVDDQGRHIERLAAEDFAVRVDGKPRDVAFARYVTSGAVPEPAVGAAAARVPAPPSWSSNAPAPGSRAFLIVLDREALGIGPMVKAREAAAAFVRSLGPDDRAGLIGIPGASPLVDFTRDKERVAAALERPVAPSGEEMSGGIMRVRVSVAEAEQIGLRDGTALAAAVSRECDQEVQPDQAFRLAESVVRTRVVVDHVNVRATLEVDFRADERLGLLLPAEMREDYRPPPSNQDVGLRGFYHLDGAATYRDYVRSEVSVEVLGARVPAPNP